MEPAQQISPQTSWQSPEEEMSHQRWDHAAVLSASLLLLLMEMGLLPPALPGVPCAALRLLSMVPNTQPLCTVFQAGFTFSLVQGCATCLSKMSL